MRPIPGVRITLITDASDTPYSGMLPGHIAGFYSRDECHIDLRSLANFAQAQLYIDRVVGLDLSNNKVICANRPPVSFDLLSLDIGSTPATISVPGAAEYAIPAKPVAQLLTYWEKVTENFAQNPQQVIKIAIVGGGVGGVELALSMQANLQGIISQRVGSRGAGEQGVEEQGTGSREQGARSKGAGSREQGSREQVSREQGSREQGAGAREQGAGSKGAGSREQGSREKKIIRICKSIYFNVIPN
ncbi:FAD-dependent oxidoreductase [Calothrix rhizosoleniae]|uniref:FAD-dependent oxidoreductase n=1 Tax=Calothrix rhizosoleniae TaxID=888997 RepID=UPI003899570A